MFNDIRIAPSELYTNNIQISTQQGKEDKNNFAGMMKENSKQEKGNTINEINFSSLGAPAGFFADISMLNENDAKEIGLIGL